MTDSLFSTSLGDHGPGVLFLHGLFGQGKNWTSLAKALSAQARVLLVDLPNHGRSGWTADFSYPQMAAQIAELVSEQAGGQPYAVVGHSMGGKVAMALALSRPELVERLCVVDVSPVSTSASSSFATFIRGMRSIDLSTLDSRAEAAEKLAPAVPDPVVRSFLLQNLRRDHGADPPWRWQPNLALLGARLSEMSDWPELGLPAYEGPTLWVAGSESDYIKSEYTPAMRTLFPQVRRVTIKGAGHWVHSEQPATFETIIRQFLHLAPGSGEKT